MEAAEVTLARFLALPLAFALYGCPPGNTQDHHPLHHDFYRHWKQPGTNTSCCDARIERRDGSEVGDCEPTKAELRNGDWYAWVRQTQSWILIPDAKIIREKNPNIFDAHLCWKPWTGVICFVPPSTGG
jgi:hypothetical protein